MTTPEIMLNKWNNLGKRTKYAVIAGAVLLLIVILYVSFVSPRVKLLRNAEQGLDRAKSGYTFILQNASALKNSGNVSSQVNLSIPVKEAIQQTASELNISDVRVFEKNGKKGVGVTIKNSLSFSLVAELLTKLENQYGVTVKEIVLDKQGDGVVYVTRLLLVRLEEGSDE